MEDRKKQGRYERVTVQLRELFGKTDDPLARMATACAVLHHKMDHYFWTGFYLLKDRRLVVGPYQGPVACQELEKNRGVCWASVNRGMAVIVKDVDTFPDHISCDSRSRSEIAIPVSDRTGMIRAVFDVDSSRTESFNEVDRKMLEPILQMIYS